MYCARAHALTSGGGGAVNSILTVLGAARADAATQAAYWRLLSVAGDAGSAPAAEACGRGGDAAEV